ncbi:putative bifunctional diguanylate cyclase/phosphodiesterase [Nocardia anaemiae]|uniref:putative bifunctional diguanylate cyclase/phosphodiesterase n=1 Tax=Nocardia anaemiae TaxID=263910 RepID=UPI000A045FCD|nr:EAL domain-containing protein [Nocardia anaemiae]
MGWEAGPGAADGSRGDLTGRWTAALTGGARDHVVSTSAGGARMLLTRLAMEFEIATQTAESADRVAELGAELARSHFVGDEVLGRSIAALSTHFTKTGTITADRLADLLAAFTNGYIRAFRAWLLAEQEDVRAAEIAARRAVAEKLRASEARLRYRAHHDQLTGLPNRTKFIDALATAFADPSADFGLCYLDLDHFKLVNDTFGHAFGDQLLIQVAARLRACAQPGQLVARMGGDEFVILVPQFGETVAAVAKHMLDALTQPFEIDGHHLTVTASIGVMEGRTEHTTADELLQAVDTTMYWAKAAGRARYAVFDADRGRREHTRAELSAAMPAALLRDELFLDYQPIVALADQRMIAVEALVRWRHPELGVLAPAQFVDLAEDNGHIGALGAQVLERACRDSRDWHDRFPGRTPIVSVNVSAAEVADPTWLDRVQDVIAETGIAPDRLQLELTERAFMHTTGRPLQALRTLSEAGVRIAIDDFGTGYSNLAYLGQLPLDVVKLAGPFIRCIRTPESPGATDLLVLESIIELTHALGFTLTAECVETQYQADRLESLGCDSAQGWLFHRPMPVAEITELLSG